MKKKNILFLILFVAIMLSVVGFLLISRFHVFKGHTLVKSLQEKAADIYYCPMHPGYTSDKPGDCAICGMKLVKQKKSSPNSKIIEKPKASPGKKERKVLYYRNPMNPQATSPVAMKDSMGMDYAPVYEEEVNAGPTVQISQEKQQLIGVKTETVKKMDLTKVIRAFGKIAYDPELFVAQEEYLQALKTANATKNSVLASVTEQSNSLLSASEKKLLLLGMSKREIEELADKGSAQESLYLPGNHSAVWAYVDIYEYEIGLVKDGISVDIEADAYPGQIFTGQVISINPVLDPTTRTNKVRVEIQNPENKLKPEMFVNTRINVDLGEKLAVPESAVLDTGIRKVVYLSEPQDILEAREVVLGSKAQDYYEVISGLKAGDIVVTSGNFLVDSESKLKSAISGGEHQHGQ